MSINAMITIILLFALFKKTSFIYLGYSLWSTAILLASMLIALRLIPFDHLAISRQTNSDVFTDITNYFNLIFGNLYCLFRCRKYDKLLWK